MERLRLVFLKRRVSKCICGPFLFGEIKAQLVADARTYVGTIAFRYSAFDWNHVRVRQHFASRVQAFPLPIIVEAARVLGVSRPEGPLSSDGSGTVAVW